MCLVCVGGVSFGVNSVFEFAAVSVAQMECWGECLLGQNRVNKVLFGRVCS